MANASQGCYEIIYSYCDWCNVEKTVLTVGIGFIGGAAGKAIKAIAAGGFLGAGVALVSDVPERILDCNSKCERERCTRDRCQCSGSQQFCDDELERCCSRAGSKVLRYPSGVECLAEPIPGL